MAEPKNEAGYRTTEFWLASLAFLLGAVLASGLLDKTTTTIDNQLVGAGVSLLATLGYTWSRTQVKK